MTISSTFSRSLTFLFALSSLASFAQSTPQIAEAVDRLAQVRLYARGSVGIGGRTTQGEKDYRLIMSQSPAQATSLLEDLYAKGNAEAKAYALLGLHQLDPSRFRELQLSLQNPEDQVHSMMGCIATSSSLQQVASAIALHEGKRTEPAPISSGR